MTEPLDPSDFVTWTPAEVNTYLRSLGKADCEEFIADIQKFLRAGLRAMARITEMGEVLDRAAADEVQVRAEALGNATKVWVEANKSDEDTPALAAVVSEFETYLRDGTPPGTVGGVK